MNIALIVLAVIVVLAIIAALLLNPVIAKKNDEAIKQAKGLLNGPPLVIEPRVVGFASDPPEAGAPAGQGCLALDSEKIVFVTTAGQKQFTVPRSAITEISTPGDPRSDAKTSLEILYTDAEHGTVKAAWRLPYITPWLRELGYDWGPEGPPPEKSDEPALDDDDD